MPRNATEPNDLTPAARLSEGPMHGILGYQLAQAAIVTGHVFETTVGQVDGLRPVEFTVLALVHANPGVSARQLARGLAVTPPNITAWIDRLEARGLVARERSPTDARVQLLRATAEGAALAADCAHRLQAAESAALPTLSVVERAMLGELLHKAALARRRGSG